MYTWVKETNRSILKEKRKVLLDYGKQDESSEDRDKRPNPFWGEAKDIFTMESLILAQDERQLQA